MRILVFNSGSSSLKFQLFRVDGETPVSILRGTVHGLGEEAICEWVYGGTRQRKTITAVDHHVATRSVLDLLADLANDGRPLLHDITAVGHRIVHGGTGFTVPTLITERTLAELDVLSPLAPLHNPPALAVIQACRARLADVPMVAVFDTAFFAGLPDFVRAYALPAKWHRPPQRIRRYGFHGLAHRYMVERVAALSGADPESSRLITLQLGHGCSVAAVDGGRARETSMGFTPLEGLIMATRPGDLDPGIVLHLLEDRRMTPHELSEGLNHRAGLLGLSGESADMQTLLVLQSQGHAGATLAIEAFCHRARKYVGAYLAVLGGADAVVFGGGIGENAPEIRARICDRMEWCGLALEPAVNAAALGTEACVSSAGSGTAVYVVPVDEELLIAQDSLVCLRGV